MSDDDSRYLTNEQIEARRPWWKRQAEGCLGGCSVDLAIAAAIGTSLWFFYG